MEAKKREKTLVELFEDMRKQFYNTHGKLYTAQEAAFLTEIIKILVKLPENERESVEKVLLNDNANKSAGGKVIKDFLLRSIDE
mgnify:FL=1